MCNRASSRNERRLCYSVSDNVTGLSVWVSSEADFLSVFLCVYPSLTGARGIEGPKIQTMELSSSNRPFSPV